MKLLPLLALYFLGFSSYAANVELTVVPHSYTLRVGQWVNAEGDFRVKIHNTTTHLITAKYSASLYAENNDRRNVAKLADTVTIAAGDWYDRSFKLGTHVNGYSQGGYYKLTGAMLVDTSEGTHGEKFENGYITVYQQH